MVAVRTEGFTRVASTDEVPPGVTRKVTVDGKDVLLANVDGNYCAIGDECTHEGGPLDEGIVHHYEIECPWHGSQFDLRNGAVTQGPADAPEPSYDVVIDGKNILLKA
jgi:glycine betaine catabolism B